MKQKKRLYASLKNKIEENEEKLNMLITKFNKQNNKEQYNEDNKENKSFLLNINEINKQKNNILTVLISKNEIISPTMSFKNNKSNYLKSKVNKNVSKNKKK